MYIYIYIYIYMCVCVCVCVCVCRLCIFFVWIMNNKVFFGNQQWRIDSGPTVSQYLSAFIVRLGDDDGRCLCRPTLCCRQRQNLKFHERYFDQRCYNVLPKQESAPFNYPLICAATWPQSLLKTYKAANDRTFKGCIEKAKLFKYINKNNLYMYSVWHNYI